MERVRRPRRARDDAAAHARSAPPTPPLLALQRAAGNRAVTAMLQRTLRQDETSLGALAYDEGTDDGDAVTLKTAVQAALDEEPGLDEAAVTKALTKYASDDPPDLVYDNGAGLVKWLSDEGIKVPSRAESKEEKREKQKERWKTEENEQQEGGQQVGELFFEGDSYHLEVKPAVISGITLKTLRKIMKDKEATNFNFWFEKDGEIFVNENSPKSSKGKVTGYRWNGKKAVPM